MREAVRENPKSDAKPQNETALKSSPQAHAKSDQGTQANPVPTQKPKAPAKSSAGVDGSKKRMYMTASIAAVLIIFFFGGTIKGAAGKAFRTVTGATEYPEAHLPALSGEALTFPNLPGGTYSGTISGILPSRPIPLTIISLQDPRRVVVILGLEGWTPRVITLEDSSSEGKDSPRNQRILVASNGVVFSLSGSVQDGKISGVSEVLASGEKGEWSVTPMQIEAE